MLRRPWSEALLFSSLSGIENVEFISTQDAEGTLRSSECVRVYVFRCKMPRQFSLVLHV